MRKTIVNWASIVTAGTFVVTFAAVILLEYFRTPLGQIAVGESSLIEGASAALWFVAACLGIVAAVRTPRFRADLLLVAWILLILGLRELDFHNRFTSWNLTHPIKYFRASIPLGLRLGVGLFAGLPLMVAFILLLTRWRRQFLEAWRTGTPWSRGVAGWALIMLASRVADKLHGFWDRPAAGAHDAWVFRAAEETLELSLVVLTVLLLLPFALGGLKRRKAIETEPLPLDAIPEHAP